MWDAGCHEKYQWRFCRFNLKPNMGAELFDAHVIITRPL